MKENTGKTKAIGLFSGGLDSVLAIKIIQNQNIEVIGLTFTSTFFGDNQKLLEIAAKNNFHLEFIDVSEEFLKIVKKPEHGHGKNLNPCIDCKIFFLQQAAVYAEKIGAKIIFTGEVLGQRPMSQLRRQADIIEKESGLSGKLLRPLSAKLHNPTEAEIKGWVNREELYDIQGRTRKIQLELAEKFKVTDYTAPAGGCLLTQKDYAKKLQDLFDYQEMPAIIAVKLLKMGRHFRIGDTKIIVGRNFLENEQLESLKSADDHLLRVNDFNGPTTLVVGPKTVAALKFANAVTLRYSDCDQDQGLVNCFTTMEDLPIAQNSLKATQIEIEAARIN